MNDRHAIPEAAYLIASLLFIFGLKRLSSPRTARSGNMRRRHRHGAGAGRHVSAAGTWGISAAILVAIVIGTIPGWLLAKRVKMTAMPQMVSLFNGMGGACALFISLGRMDQAGSCARQGGASVSRRRVAKYPRCCWALFSGRSVSPGVWSPSANCRGLITEKPLRWPVQKVHQCRFCSWSFS